MRWPRYTGAVRIVSLVPNATEIVYALGAQDHLVGVSHECDFPREARHLPILTGSALAQSLSISEVDSAVSEQLADGSSLYTINEKRVEELEPDLILTQHLCPVCAVSREQVDGALAPLEECPDVMSLDPKTLEDVFDNIRAVGKRLERSNDAARVVERLVDRLDHVRQLVAERERPTVCALEWLDPLYLAGHWVPEMIEIAGGTDLFAKPGDPSKRATWAEVQDADPDVVVAMPCGFDEAGATEQLAQLTQHSIGLGLRAVRNGRAFAVDANGCFSRPGPRLVDGIETLTRLFHGVGV